MGNLITRFKQDPDEVESAGNLTDYEIQSSMKKNNRKRKSGNSQSDNSSSKITKLDTTSYVYDKLFMKGEGSDFSVIALGERWKLHKLYLKQCSYFEALLDGVWKDSGDEVLHLEINDENVTIEGLNAVFGSLYNNEILLDVENIGGILAAAFLVGLDSVIDRCSEMMSEGMTMHNVINFYQIAERYALLKVRESSLKYLETSFCRFMRCPRILREMNETSLCELLNSSELLVIEGEMDLYAMIRSWIFLEEQTPQISYECKDLHYTQQEKKFFSENNGDALFLKYHKLFAALRINNCLTTSGAIRTFQENKLVPQEILNDIIVDQWNCLLKNEETPTVSNTMSEEVFNKSCLRSGRAIQEFPKSWRWTGFNFGTDVLLTASRLALTVKRNCVHQISPYSANMQGEKVLHYRLIIMDAEGKRIHDGKRISVALRPDQTIVLSTFKPDVALPIFVHFQYLAFEPPPPTSQYIEKYLEGTK